MSKAVVPADYAEFLTDLKERIRGAQITAARAVNRELILLYWDIGRAMKERSCSREAAIALSCGCKPADGIQSIQPPAAKRRQQVAAGVSPQARCTQSTIEPRSGGSNAPVTTCCRRYAAKCGFRHRLLGLTPQAMCDRRFAAVTNAVRRALPTSKEDH